MLSKVAIAYIPVLHKGYIDFVRQLEEEDVTELCLIGDDILEAHEELDYINRKDRLRALEVDEVCQALNQLTNISVAVLTPNLIAELQSTAVIIITPREDIGEVVVKSYFSNNDINYRNVFVRRNKLSIGEKRVPDVASVSVSEFQDNVWQQVFTEAAKSADWWRQVGAALVKDGEIIYVTHNEHMPEEQLPNIEGDARSLFKKGVHVNYVTSAHAEVAAIGAAAKHGVVTEGAELYTTDFPCPYCARLIAKAGIKKVYFIRGYAVLEGDEFLRGEGVELVHVRV